VTNTDVDSAVAVLRAFLTRDFSTYQSLREGLDASQRQAFAVVLAAAFTSAATRRFGERPPTADVIGFVAEARASYPTAAGILSAEDAETVIRASTGDDDLIGTLDGRRSGAAQTAMLFALTRENEAPAAAIDALLAEAATQAEDYFQRRAGR
jgi:hypothetical protein